MMKKEKQGVPAFKKILARFRSSRSLRAVLPVLLLSAGFCLLLLRKALSFENVILNLAGPGSFLLAGLPGGLNYRMPLLETFFSAVLNSGISPALFFVLVNLGICALVFCAGCLLSGYWGGFFSLAATAFFVEGGRFECDIEQAFYAFTLLLVLALLFIRRRENTLKVNLLAGLAVGISMLVRSPLFLFPPVLVLCDVIFLGERSRAFLLRSLVFLSASYVLLVPWGVLNYSVTGQFDLLDSKNAADNVITGALGSIYTMEGDSARLAGLAADDSAIKFYLREAVKDPLSYMVTISRRLWHIFWLFPLLFGLFLVMVAVYWGRDKIPVLIMPAYFILIHSAFSIEARYFYPLIYILPMLTIISVWSGSFSSSERECGPTRKMVYGLFWLLFCATLIVEAFIIAYPPRAARKIEGSESFYAAIERFPNDRVLQKIKCHKFWESGDDAGFYKCLGGYSEKFHDKFTIYFLSAIMSRSPEKLEIPLASEMECLIARMLREFELGDEASAMASFRRAYAKYEMTFNTLRGQPYERDKELESLIRRDSDRFWDKHVYGILMLWPPESMTRILSALKAYIKFTQKFRLLECVLGNARTRGESDGRPLRKRISSDTFGIAYDELDLLWKKETEQTGKLNSLAVEKMRSGDFKAAKSLLLKAVEINRTNPAVLMNLCAILVRENKKEQALEACQGAAYAVRSSAQNRLPGFELLAADASFESYKLLLSLDRKTEAAELLRRTVESAPASWGGLAGARKALEKTGLK